MTYETRDTSDDDDEPTGYQPGVRDRLLYLRYTLWPTSYTDETSDVRELLWQITLEQRATRYWLALLVGVLTATLAVLVGVLVLRTT